MSDDRSMLLTFTAVAAAGQGHFEDELLRRFIDVVEPQTVDGDVGSLTRYAVDGLRTDLS